MVKKLTLAAGLLLALKSPIYKPSYKPFYLFSILDNKPNPPLTNALYTNISFIYYIVAIIVYANIIYRKRFKRKIKEFL